MSLLKSIKKELYNNPTDQDNEIEKLSIEEIKKKISEVQALIAKQDADTTSCCMKCIKNFCNPKKIFCSHKKTHYEKIYKKSFSTSVEHLGKENCFKIILALEKNEIQKIEEEKKSIKDTVNANQSEIDNNNAIINNNIQNIKKLPELNDTQYDLIQHIKSIHNNLNCINTSMLELRNVFSSARDKYPLKTPQPYASYIEGFEKKITTYTTSFQTHLTAYNDRYSNAINYSPIETTKNSTANDSNTSNDNKK
ncbi:hypothetical protein NEFER03_1126 [Nematocida sp. LUAm3]|nr:hypothetical protein NEFER03_1126 [Nematocida sp. LUAm3]KAI5176338.1 hypothetical protein NEFER02_2126 [Nematocida sp. LUAm2]KAI5178231.1 hypothetical protein NEFER01_1398 [Nematocida sp. LUAm1]